ncbi:MAG: glycosyltransferase [Verrucomicrobia bacterium]|nr:glycosyltransferase [Verrucomicrobiota bacterium]
MNSLAVVTPSFNQGKYIRQTIESVLAQRVQNLQYMVIDGGSTDETVEVLGSFGGKLKWISEPDRGTADAINKGFHSVGGEVLGWLNSDDIYYDGALESVQEFFEKNPDVDVVYGDADHIDADGSFIEKYPTEPWSWERFHEVCFISQPAAFFRRRVFERFGALDVRYPHCVDYELWIRWAKSGAIFQHLPKTLAATRLHAEAKTVAKRLACHEDINNILRNHLGKVPERWVLNYAYAAADDRGVRREQQLRFASALVKESVVASARWNRGLEWNLVKTLGGLMGDAIRHELAKRE